MAEISGFEELSNLLDGLAEQFRDRARRQNQVGRDPETGQFISVDGFKPKERIGAGISNSFRGRGGIVEQAQSEGSAFLTDQAVASIKHEQLRWNHHRFGGTHELVKYHEFGTGTEAESDRKGTTNAPDGSGYVIPLSGYDSLPFGPEAVNNMDELNFRYVVHPGVENKRFLRETLDKNAGRIEEEVAQQLDEIEIDI